MAGGGGVWEMPREEVLRRPLNPPPSARSTLKFSICCVCAPRFQCTVSCMNPGLPLYNKECIAEGESRPETLTSRRAMLSIVHLRRIPTQILIRTLELISTFSIFKSPAHPGDHVGHAQRIAQTTPLSTNTQHW